MFLAIYFVDTRIISFGIILFIYSLLIGFGALVKALISRLWGEASDEATTARMIEMAKEPQIRKSVRSGESAM